MEKRGYHNPLLGVVLKSKYWCALCLIVLNGAHLTNSVQPLVFRGFSVKYREMSKNYIFRELECQMTKE